MNERINNLEHAQNLALAEESALRAGELSAALALSTEGFVPPTPHEAAQNAESQVGIIESYRRHHTMGREATPALSQAIDRHAKLIGLMPNGYGYDADPLSPIGESELTTLRNVVATTKNMSINRLDPSLEPKATKITAPNKTNFRAGTINGFDMDTHDGSDAYRKTMTFLAVDSGNLEAMTPDAVTMYDAAGAMSEVRTVPTAYPGISLEQTTWYENQPEGKIPGVGYMPRSYELSLVPTVNPEAAPASA